MLTSSVSTHELCLHLLTCPSLLQARAASFFYGSWLWVAASSPSTASSSSSSGPGGEAKVHPELRGELPHFRAPHHPPHSFPQMLRFCMEPALLGSPSWTPDPHTPFRRIISTRNTNERKMLWAIPPPKDCSLLKTSQKTGVQPNECSAVGKESKNQFLGGRKK